MEIPGEEIEKETENIIEIIMTENFSKLISETNIPRKPREY